LPLRGGLRATFFHLGVLAALRENNLLRNVKEVFSVSGGSIIAAHLIANWPLYTGKPHEFEAAVHGLRSVATRDIRGRVIRRWLLSIAFLVPRLLGLSRTTLLSREYRALFGSESLRRTCLKHGDSR
jgi:predicted acylesterase/phospholipase RssA